MNMDKKVILTTLVVACLSFHVIGQKLKYKSVFAKLSDKQYEEAYTDLTNFLEANPEHASANLQMAILAEEHLKDCEKAKPYYEKAKRLIDKKELQRNEKYYESYRRRDFRSGKMTVRLSDITTDIDRRIGNCAGS